MLAECGKPMPQTPTTISFQVDFSRISLLLSVKNLDFKEYA